MEKEVEVRCLENDIELVASVSKQCEEDFTKLFKDEIGKDIKCKVVVNKDTTLEREGVKW